MTATETVSLPDAIQRLKRAIHQLTDPIRTHVPGHGVIESPDDWSQLVSAVGEARRGEVSGRRHATSTAPVWADALDLQAEVERETRKWFPELDDVPARLRALAEHRWAPADAEWVDAAARQINVWLARSRQLVDPRPVKTISAACPSCSSTTVYRFDSTGERVRQPALQLVGDLGCTCLACGAHWAPSHYMLLCRVLGFQLPDGVLE